MINLIKAGAFDKFGDRTDLMHEYVASISDCKKRITLQNMKMLIDFNLIPDEYDLQRRVYNFNKYIKKMKNGEYYGFDNIAFDFYSNHFDIDLCTTVNTTESGFQIKQTIWDNIYKKQMDIIRPFVQKNSATLLEAVNNRLIADTWNKYCLGSVSKWEMDSISCYIHDHELKIIENNLYDISNFNDLPDEPEIDYIANFRGKQVPIFRLRRIAGTVLDRDKSKKTVTLLTNDGVVTVKIYGVFAQYDKQISERGADGKKHVIRKSEFSRGNKIIITGVRMGDSFLAKVYSKTEWHRIETIESISEKGIITFNNRQDLEEK